MPAIDVIDLSKRYAGRTVLDGITFSVEEGEIFGILGPNGAGKTTTVEILEGLRTADSGSVQILGLDPVADGRRLRQLIGVQLQHTELPDNLKVWEALDLYASFYEQPRNWRELIDEWGLSDQRNVRFAKLSGGQKQRLIIALALVGNPRIAFLDELTTGLDPQARRATWQLVEQIRAAGVTVVLVSHFMDEVEELCDRVAVISQGRIAAIDTPAALIDAVDAEHAMRFRVESEEGTRILDAIRTLPGVTSARITADVVVVSGTSDFATAVTTLLAREHIVATDLRIDKRTLDDAFAALTGRTFDH
ncbi:ABC transporter ATP-binding protein [Microbacterium sp. p3-SID336]|uniref:ABC transporter ATP-binding protein n=1 Tax=Microbacterium sp. p3-SID336 TaxID=2916212 RepID=UPI0021A848EF|nr:ABC transporter ATP-binding protein [Microbacterium sp. p3-SID336]MCT1478717.1 ABC transporter ATP-binding protein [Microbacterium sp. p3-SID336]